MTLLPDLSNPGIDAYINSLTTSSGALNAPTTGLTPQYSSPGVTSPFSLASSVPNYDFGILQQSLPTAVTSFTSKYGDNNPLQQSLSSPVYNALKAYDSIRLQKGQSPLSEAITADVAKAAETGQSVAPEPKTGNLLSNALDDLKSMVGGIPAIPGQVVHEIQHASELPEKIAEVQKNSKGDIRQELGGYLQLPLVNMVPGTFAASNVVSGNYGTLAEHPLMTALDVLPYVNKVAKAAPVFRAAEEANFARAAEESALSGIPREAKAPNPIKTVLTQKLEGGQVVPNTLGRGIDVAAGAAGSTHLGQLMRDAWSDPARFGSRVFANEQEAFRNNLNPTGRENLDPVTQWAREANSLPSKYKDIDEVRRHEIDAAMMDPVNNQMPVDLTDSEVAYQTDVKDLTARAKANLDTDGDLATRDWNGNPEIFTKQEAQRLDRVNKLSEDYAQNYRVGQNAREQLAAWKNRDVHSKDAQVELLGQQMSTIDNSIASQNVNRVQEALKSISRSDPVANRFLNRLSKEDYQGAISTFKLMKTGKWDDILSDVDRDSVLTELQNARGFKADADKFSRFTERGLASRQRRVDMVSNSITPARFTPIRDALIKENLKGIIQGLDDPGIAQHLEYLDNNAIPSLVSKGVLTPKDYTSALREAQGTVAKLAEDGIDPIFLHKVNPLEAKKITFPSLSDVKTTPSWTKSRGIDLTPSTPDYQVALSHQGMEKLKQIHTDNVIDTMGRTFGKKYTELYDEYFPMAQQRLAQNPNLDVQTFIDNQIKKAGFTRFDTESYTPWKKQPTSSLKAAEDIYVPTSIANNLKRVMTGPGKLLATFDPVMKLFRTSVLALSPRWLINNMFGGLFMSLAETSNPLKFMTNMREAWSMAKSGELENIPGLRGRGAADISPEDMAWLDAKVKGLTGEGKAAALNNFKGGQSLRRLIESDPASTLFKAGNKLVAGSYKINQLFDDMYRASTYLTERDTALTKGLTAAESEGRGIAMARRVMQNWDELTPLERTGLRFALPFYGFMQHMLRFVARYPFDHPIRTSILGSFARNELNDLGSGLPQQFQSMMFVGGQDENGNQKAINLSGANPFGVVGDSFTLAGLLGQTNPVVSSLADTLGLDPVSSTADLYPNVIYNPETGKLEAAQGNYFSNLLGNTLPLANMASNLLPNNQEFKQLLATNPEAAGRQLMANAGIPVLLRNVNKPQEIIKAEKNRIENQGNVKSAAMKTGDYSQAEQYPALKAWMDQMASLNSQGQLDQYKPVNVQVANPALSLVQAVQGQSPVTAAYGNQVLSLRG